jgi:hypothetical protein
LFEKALFENVLTNLFENEFEKMSFEDMVTNVFENELEKNVVRRKCDHQIVRK